MSASKTSAADGEWPRWAQNRHCWNELRCPRAGLPFRKPKEGRQVTLFESEVLEAILPEYKPASRGRNSLFGR